MESFLICSVFIFAINIIRFRNLPRQQEYNIVILSIFEYVLFFANWL